MRTHLEIPEVSVGEDTFVFSPPTTLLVGTDPEGSIYLTGFNRKFNLSVSGKDQEELLTDFADTIAMLWREYAEEEDEKLTEDAIELKRLLLKHVQKRPKG